MLPIIGGQDDLARFQKWNLNAPAVVQGYLFGSEWRSCFVFNPLSWHWQRAGFDITIKTDLVLG